MDELQVLEGAACDYGSDGKTRCQLGDLHFDGNEQYPAVYGGAPPGAPRMKVTPSDEEAVHCNDSPTPLHGLCFIPSGAVMREVVQAASGEEHGEPAGSADGEQGNAQRRPVGGG